MIIFSILSACTTHNSSQPPLPVTIEQQNYQAHAHSYYTPPGPSQDPWGPYIKEAAERFDIPEIWIRAVMHQESGGHIFDNHGHFVTSIPGAMGLMQIMPPAYDDLKNQYNLGPDPYNPHDNILAGTAYMRQMYEIYGSPGFLAAYNYGPGSLDRYLKQNRSLPKETRHYIMTIAPHIAGIWPHQRSHNDLIVSQYEATRHHTTTLQNKVSNNSQAISSTWASRGFSQSSTAQPHHPPVTHNNIPQPSTDHTLYIQNIPLAPSRAYAGHYSDITSQHTYEWAIQLGAYFNKQQALNITTHLRLLTNLPAQNVPIQIDTIHTHKKTIYLARLLHVSHEQAIAACTKLKSKSSCIPLPPHTHL